MPDTKLRPSEEWDVISIMYYKWKKHSERCKHCYHGNRPTYTHTNTRTQHKQTDRTDYNTLCHS